MPLGYTLFFVSLKNALSRRFFVSYKIFKKTLKIFIQTLDITHTFFYNNNYEKFIFAKLFVYY